MLQEFNKKKILLAYYGGSTAYQTTNENSDKDVIVREGREVIGHEKYPLLIEKSTIV